ncbi:hypothetical protein INR49_020380 [Caranx melampygus]|nr:hypothetical protein INR49_020380 [Caranx melampygus]
MQICGGGGGGSSSGDRTPTPAQTHVAMTKVQFTEESNESWDTTDPRRIHLLQLFWRTLGDRSEASRRLLGI